MPNFLYQTAEYLVGTYHEKVSDLCIVLPNRRGGLFLKKYLGSIINKTLWSPAIYSIEDFLAAISHLEIADNTRILFELYEVHRSVEGKKAQPFADFIGWGQQLVNDFSEIDSNLADPAALFGYLSEARAISVWNLDQKPLTEFETKYLSFYRSLDTYYRLLKTRLLEQHIAYPGLLFRSVAEQITTTKEKLPWMKMVFAGFNALTVAEEKIIDELYKDGKADLLWDADHYYLDNSQQEAGDFLRKWIRKWDHGEPKWIGNDLVNSSKNITITGVPLNIGQVKYGGKILSDLIDQGASPEECTVVLMDEQLLIPLLNSIPGNTGELNITMGLSLKQTPMYTLVSSMIGMNENSARFKKASEKGTWRFYFRDVIRILRHPYLQRVAEIRMKGNRFALDDLVGSLRTGNRIFLTREQLLAGDEGLFSANLSFLEPFFESWNDPVHAIENLRLVMDTLKNSFITGLHRETGGSSKDPGMEMEYLYAFSRLVYQVATLIGRYGTVTDLPGFYRLFDRLAEITTLPFYGEPLKGVQVMGMLETRTLDFENIILLSVNEDLLPGAKTSSSFIPYDIRRDFKLPTWQHRNSVYAYHFYRLIQRAKNVTIVYNTEPDELGGGEQSRFITQIMNELATLNKNVIINKQILSTPLTSLPELLPLTIPKDKQILEKLDELAGKGLSPSSLNEYRDCSLKFYFSAIAGLEEIVEPEDSVDARVLGLAVHSVLHQLYRQFAGKVLTPENIDSMMPLIGDLTSEAFIKKSEGADLSYGKNLLLLEVGKIMVRNFLKFEKENLDVRVTEGQPTVIKFLEYLLTGELTISLKAGTKKINLKGFADRIDRVGNDWQIIDYKTGKVNSTELKIKEWDNLVTDPAAAKAFQLVMYAYLHSTMTAKEKRGISAGIIAMNKIKSGFLPVTIPGNDKSGVASRDMLLNFEKILQRLLTEIFDPEIPFQQTENREICEKCPFVNLCAR